MPLDGWAAWTEPYIFERAYLDGTWVDQLPVSMPAEQGLFALRTHAGTDIIQQAYRGDDRSEECTPYTFTLTAQAAQQVGWFALKKAKAKGAAFYFGPGIRCVEVFTATSGGTYTLSRPLAAGIVPGVTSGSGSGTHPYTIYLNGSLSPSSASASGQVLTAAATGEITIEYTPVHLCIFTTFNENVAGFNDSSLALVIQEVLS